MRNVLVFITTMALALMAAAFVGPRVIDWDGYRGTIEEEATRLLGRDVRVGGRVQVHLLPSPTFAVENIRIADIEANAGEPFFRAEALTGTLAVTPLLRGALQAREVVLRRPKLHIVLDADGGGNWTSIGRGARVPFLSGDVALDAVRIEGGQLSIYGPDRVERVHLEAIDGELSVAALDGPYRFRGFFGADPIRREVRIGTTKREGDGSLRFKASVKHLDTNALFNFDARALDLARAPRVEGELSAQIPLPQFAASTPARPGAAAAEIEAPVEIKAALSAGARSVRLAGLTLAFERQGRPQILNGEAVVDLVAPANGDITLAAKWLDLDQLIGTPAVDGPLAGLLQLATRLNGFNPDQGTARLQLDVEQAMLGREPVSGLRLRLRGRGAETEIEELRIGLPGSARADLKGLMTGSGDETTFDGSLLVRGGSLARLLAWGTAGALVLDPARDGPFATRARLQAGPQSLQARDFVGEIAGTVVQGAIGYRWQGRREISVLVEGPQVDLRPLLAPREGPPPALLDILREGVALGPRSSDRDAVVRIRTGQLLVPGASYQDVAADLELRSGALRVGQLKLAAGPGVAIEVEGDVPTAAAATPARLRGLLTAQDTRALVALADLVALPRTALPADDVLSALVPLRMAGDLAFEAAPGRGVSFQGDGDVGGSRLRLSGRLADGLDAWRTAPLDLSATIDGPRAQSLVVAWAGGALPSRSADTAAPSLAQVVIDAGGTVAGGLTGRLAYTSGAGLIEFRGRAGVDGEAATPAAAASQLRLDGDVRIEASDAATLARQLWPGMPSGALVERPVAGSFAVTRQGDDTRIARLGLRLGDTNVRGSALLRRMDGRLDVTGDLQATTLSVHDLLRSFLVPTPPLVATAQALTADVRSVWMRAPFLPRGELTASGLIRLQTDVLVWPTAGQLRDARMAIAFGPERLEVRDLTGQGARGQWSGALTIDHTATPASATALVRFADVELADVAPGAGVKGLVAGVVTLTGRGTSPEAMVSSLAGRGTVTLGETQIDALQPATIAAALAQAVRGPAEGLGPRLRQSLLEAKANQAPIVVPARAVPLEVARGVVTGRPVAAELADGQVTANLALDLSSLVVSGDWNAAATTDALPAPPSWTATVAPAAKAPAAKPAPVVLMAPVVTRFAGALPTVGLAPGTRITESLEREVAVRRMERDIDELERLRRLDEERAKAEAERRRLLETGASPPAVPPVEAGTAIAIPPGGVAPVSPGVIPAAPATDATDPTAKAKSPPPAPPPKSLYRPLTQEEQRRIFGGG